MAMLPSSAKARATQTARYEERLREIADAVLPRSLNPDDAPALVTEAVETLRAAVAAQPRDLTLVREQVLELGASALRAIQAIVETEAPPGLVNPTQDRLAAHDRRLRAQHCQSANSDRRPCRPLLGRDRSGGHALCRRRPAESLRCACGATTLAIQSRRACRSCYGPLTPCRTPVEDRNGQQGHRPCWNDPASRLGARQPHACAARPRPSSVHDLIAQADRRAVPAVTWPAVMRRLFEPDMPWMCHLRRRVNGAGAK